MNILTVTANFGLVGGAARIAHDLCESYTAAGHTVGVLAGKASLTRENLAVLRRPLWRKGLAWLLANDFDFFDGGQILQSPLFERADIVHCHNLNGWYFHLPTLVEMARRKPVVWTLHDQWALTPHSSHTDSRELRHGLFTLSDPSLYPNLLWDNAEHLAKRKSAIYRDLEINLVTPSDWLTELVGRTALAGKPVRTIYNGIDTGLFSPRDRSSRRASLGLDSHSPVVLFVGSAATSNVFKGFVDFEWLAKQNEQAEVQFVVLGAEQDEIRDGIRLLAATSDKSRIADIMSAADVLVLPSRHEVAPLVILEALACGTPVVAYDVGGVGELVASAPGSRLVPALDRLALLRAVHDVIGRPEAEREALSAGIRRHVVDRYSTERMTRQYLSLFEELLTQRSGVS